MSAPIHRDDALRRLANLAQTNSSRLAAATSTYWRYPPMGVGASGEAESLSFIVDRGCQLPAPERSGHL
jgi:hypothetical protein